MVGETLRPVLLDPRDLTLHEVPQPTRLAALLETLAVTRVLERPVLVTGGPGGPGALLVLDGVHRTSALLHLGITRVVARHLPRDHAGDPGSWTHVLTDRRPDAGVLERLSGSEDVTMVPGTGQETTGQGTRRAPGAAAVVAELVLHRAGGAGPRAAQPETTRVEAARSGPEGLLAAYHAVAEAYRELAYRRTAEPTDPAPGELQVRWRAPTLRTVELLARDHGPLPAGITRFSRAGGLARCPVTLEELAGAVDPAARASLWERVLRDAG